MSGNHSIKKIIILLKNKDLQKLIKKSALLFIILLFSIFLYAPPTILAASVTTSTQTSSQIKFTPQVGLPGFMQTTTFTSNSTIYIAQLMKELFKYGVQIIVVLSLIIMIAGGFLWSTAGGSGQRVTEAKQWVISGLSGLLLTLFTYLILNTINVNLVNLEPTKIKITGGLDLLVTRKSDQTQHFADAAQKTMTVAESTDSEGKKACCLAKVPDRPDRVNPYKLALAQELHCATLQATYYRGMNTDSPSAEKLCVDFFNDLIVRPEQNIANITIVHNISDFIYNEDSVPENDAILLYDGFCEENESLKTICMGKDHPDYCNTRLTGSECITKDNYWGYCNTNKQCIKCKNYGQGADNYYECPDYVGQRLEDGTHIGFKNSGQNPEDPLGYKCGIHMLGCNGGSKDQNGKHRCVCHSAFCYNECIQNGGKKNRTIINECYNVSAKDQKRGFASIENYELKCKK